MFAVSSGPPFLLTVRWTVCSLLGAPSGPGLVRCGAFRGACLFTPRRRTMRRSSVPPLFLRTRYGFASGYIWVVLVCTCCVR